MRFRYKVLTGLLLVASVLGSSPALAAITDADVAGLGKPIAVEKNAIKDSPTVFQMISRLAVSFGAVLGLIALVAWAARKYLPAQVAPGKSGPIQVLFTRSIGQRKSLLLVRVQDKTVLLGTTPQSVQFLTDVEEGRGAWNEAELQAALAGVDADPSRNAA